MRRTQLNHFLGAYIKMNEKPFVSVLMAVRNEEKYVRRSIQSILTQVHKNLEVIIVDDASTDQTSEEIRSIDDKRVRSYKNPKNEGLAASLNSAAKLARGDFLARQDADEYSAPSRIARQLEVFQSNPDIGVVATSHFFMDNELTKILEVLLPTADAYSNQDFAEKGPRFCHGSVMIRRALLEKIGFYDERFLKAQDLDLWLRISSLGSKEMFYVINSPLYGRRIDAYRLQSRRAQKLFRCAALEKNRKNAQKARIYLDKGRAAKSKHISKRRILALDWYLKAMHFSSAGNFKESWISVLKGLRVAPWEPRLIKAGFGNVKNYIRFKKMA